MSGKRQGNSTETDPRAFPPGSLVAAYLRDSGGKKQDLSVGQQENVIRQYCQANGLVLSQVFKDEAQSGKSVAGRDEFDRLMEHFEGRNAPEKGILFYDYSRWARNFNDGTYFLAAIRRKGYKAYSLEEQVPDGVMGQVMEAFHLGMAEAYRLTLSRNVKRGMYDLTAQFHAYFSEPPPGYRYRPVVIGKGRDKDPATGEYINRTVNQLEPDPETAERVRRAFRMRAEGRSIREIHNQTHLYPYSGSYSYMLVNPLYIGRHVWGTLEIDDFCEPLIDLATWEAVQRINEQNKTRQGPGHPRRNESPYLLSGILRCAVCGRTMGGSSVRAQRWYRCADNVGPKDDCPAKHIQCALVEGRVIDRLTAALTEPERAWEWYRKARAKAQAETGRVDVEEAEIKQALSKNRAALARYTRMVELAETEEPDAMRALLAPIAKLQKEQDELLARGAKIRPARAVNFPDLTREQAELVAQAAAEKLASGDFRERQLALRSMVVDITAVRVGRREVGGKMVYIPPFSDGEAEECSLE